MAANYVRATTVPKQAVSPAISRVIQMTQRISRPRIPSENSTGYSFAESACSFETS